MFSKFSNTDHTSMVQRSSVTDCAAVQLFIGSTFNLRRPGVVLMEIYFLTGNYYKRVRLCTFRHPNIHSWGSDVIRQPCTG